MESPSESWAREMSRAASGSLVDTPELERAWRLAGSGPIMVREPRPGEGRVGTWDSDVNAIAPAKAPEWDFGFLARLGSALGPVELRYDARIDSVLLMDETTAIGVVVRRRSIEEFGGLSAALAAGLGKLLEVRSWPAERRLAIGGK